MIKYTSIFFLLAVLLLGSCSQKKEKLPIYGPRDVSESGDTSYFKVPAFAFINQDGKKITNETFDDKVYVTSFFFTSCPGICPIIMGQMKRIQDEHAHQTGLMMLSHTLDPKHDSPEVLKEYADRRGADLEKWHFVTGESNEIFKMSKEGYFMAAASDINAPGGIDHTSRITLIDKNRRIRGSYDGTNPESVDELIDDIDVLLKEYE